MSFFFKKNGTAGENTQKVAYTQFDKLHNLQALNITAVKAKRDSPINKIYCSVLDTA